jgi:hypothetical protein
MSINELEVSGSDRISKWEKKGAHHPFECDEDLHMKKVQS